MSLSIPKFIVRKISSATNYTSSPEGCSIDLRVSNPWEATITMNNSSGLYTGVFSCEDEVALFINEATAANLVMVGFIDEITDTGDRKNERIQVIHIVDWISYYAAKTIYEREWLRSTTTAARIINGMGVYPSTTELVFGGSTVAEISGLTSLVTDLNNPSTITPPLTPDEIPRKFNGTYVKDAWQTIAENSGADFIPSYSVNAGLTTYTKKINFFKHGKFNLTESTTGLIYKIKDIVPTTSDTLMIIHNNQYEFTQSAKYRFTSVVAMSGQEETYPDDKTSWCKTSFGVHPTLGKQLSDMIMPFKSGTIDAHWNVTTAGTSIDPFTFIADETLCTASDGTMTFPTVKLNIRNTSTVAETFIVGRTNETTTAPTFNNMGLSVTDWQRIGFFIKNGLTGTTVNKIILRLYDYPVGADYWERDIYNDIIVSGGSRTSWTYVEYALPANTTDTTSNGWTKNGSPTTIDQIYMNFQNGASLLTGYTSGSYIGLAMIYFYRRQRGTATGSGVLTTEKIIIDGTTKITTALETLATKELARINVVGKSGRFTIVGNIKFISPGYNIQVDFSNTLGSGRSGTVRISHIRHYLDNGRYFTYVEFEDAYQRA